MHSGCVLPVIVESHVAHQQNFAVRQISRKLTVNFLTVTVAASQLFPTAVTI